MVPVRESWAWFQPQDASESPAQLCSVLGHIFLWTPNLLGANQP